jgi:hypothetical protein
MAGGGETPGLPWRGGQSHPQVVPSCRLVRPQRIPALLPTDMCSHGGAWEPDVGASSEWIACRAMQTRAYAPIQLPSFGGGLDKLKSMVGLGGGGANPLDQIDLSKAYTIEQHAKTLSHIASMANMASMLPASLVSSVRCPHVTLAHAAAGWAHGDPSFTRTNRGDAGSICSHMG